MKMDTVILRSATGRKVEVRAMDGFLRLQVEEADGTVLRSSVLAAESSLTRITQCRQAAVLADGAETDWAEVLVAARMIDR